MDAPPAPASCVKTLCLISGLISVQAEHMGQAQRQGWSHKGQVVFEG